MGEISFKRHRFPPDVIRYAVWLYYCFMMSLRDVDKEGEAFDILVRKRRNKAAALKLLRKLFKKVLSKQMHRLALSATDR